MTETGNNVDQERVDIIETLQAHRRFLRYTVEGLSDEEAAKRTTVSELCLGGLVKHVTKVEEGWVRFVHEGPSAMAGARRGGHGRPRRQLPHARGRDLGRIVWAATKRSRPGPTSWSRRFPLSTSRTLCPRRPGSRRTRAGRPGGCSCTWPPRRRSTPATPTSSARRSTVRRRWAEIPSPHERAEGSPSLSSFLLAPEPRCRRRPTDLVVRVRPVEQAHVLPERPHLARALTAVLVALGVGAPARAVVSDSGRARDGLDAGVLVPVVPRGHHDDGQGRVDLGDGHAAEHLVERRRRSVTR